MAIIKRRIDKGGDTLIYEYVDSETGEVVKTQYLPKPSPITSKDIAEVEVKDDAGTSRIIEKYEEGEVAERITVTPGSAPTYETQGRGGIIRRVPVNIKVEKYKQNKLAALGSGSGDLIFTSSRVALPLAQIKAKDLTREQEALIRVERGEATPSDVFIAAQEKAKYGIFQTKDATPAEQWQIFEKVRLEQKGQGALKWTAKLADTAGNIFGLSEDIKQGIKGKLRPELLEDPLVRGAAGFIGGFVTAPLDIAGVILAAPVGMELLVRDPGLAKQSFEFTVGNILPTFTADPAEFLGRVSGSIAFTKVMQTGAERISQFRQQSFVPTEHSISLVIGDTSDEVTRVTGKSTVTGTLTSEYPGGFFKRSYPAAVNVDVGADVVGVVIDAGDTPLTYQAVSGSGYAEIRTALKVSGKTISDLVVSKFGFTSDVAEYTAAQATADDVLYTGGYRRFKTVVELPVEMIQSDTGQIFVSGQKGAYSFQVSGTFGTATRAGDRALIMSRGVVVTGPGGKGGVAGSYGQEFSLSQMPDEIVTVSIPGADFKKSSVPLSSIFAETKGVEALKSLGLEVAQETDVRAVSSAISGIPAATGAVALTTYRTGASLEKSLETVGVVGTTLTPAEKTTFKEGLVSAVKTVPVSESLTASAMEFKEDSATSYKFEEISAQVLATDVEEALDQPQRLKQAQLLELAPTTPALDFPPFFSFPPIRSEPMLGFFDFRLGSTKGKRGKQTFGTTPTKYKPSLAAILLDIKGSPPARLTGLEIRPIQV